ncbi:MAG: hypothetical protein V4691_04125 [Pseudomonadota bacterium]
MGGIGGFFKDLGKAAVGVADAFAKQSQKADQFGGCMQMASKNDMLYQNKLQEIESDKSMGYQEKQIAKDFFTNSWQNNVAINDANKWYGRGTENGTFTGVS